MTIREMKNEFEGWTFYESTFDLETGTLVRVHEEPDERHGSFLDAHPGGRRHPHYPGTPPYKLEGEEREKAYEAQSKWRDENPTLADRWRNAGFRRSSAFSPVPETIDVSITDACTNNCAYCYQGSNSEGEHAPVKLIETIFEGLDLAPYQIALGGGEPTLHPELPAILELIRSNETVPSFTTGGYNFRQDVIDAANEFVGGVALTYHRHRGIGWFVKTFRAWKEALRPGVQLNIHVIADKDGARSLNELYEAFDGTGGLSLGDLNIVLLAYVPSKGRAGLDRIMPKSVYMRDFPEAIARLTTATKGLYGSQAKVAFSEGLLPLFVSRPELGLDLTYATSLEGRFSCYVNPRGFLARSSFEYIQEDEDPEGWGSPDPNIYETRFQELWSGAPYHWDPRGPCGGPCYDCVYNAHRCTEIHSTLMFMCKWQNVNQPTEDPPLTERAKEQRAFWDRVHEETEE